MNYINNIDLKYYAARFPLGTLQPYAHRSVSNITALATRIPFGHPIAGYLLGKFFYQLFDQGLANILGLETLRHGTNSFSYLSIRLFGGQPKCGGISTGSTKFLSDSDEKNNVKGYFYVFKDSEWNANLTKDKNINFIKKISSKPIIGKLLFPKLHCYLSGYNFVIYSFYLNENENYNLIGAMIRKCLKRTLGIFGGLISLTLVPTLKFRISMMSEKYFGLINDPFYCNVAYRTQQAIRPWRIGLLGTLVSGINFDWYKRARANPFKILTGIVQLVGAAAIGTLIVQSIATSALATTPIKLGMLLC